MPSSYTDPMYQGTPITFEEFAMRCARGMGVAILQRDEPVDVPIRDRQVPDHYREAVEEAAAALDEARQRTEEEWAEIQHAELRNAIARRDEEIARDQAMRERYETMLEAARQWEPPTVDHYGLRAFMIAQLEESIQFDLGLVPKLPERLEPRAYGDHVTARLARTLQQRTETLDEQNRLAAAQRAWLAALRESLSSTPENEPADAEGATDAHDA